jgi:choline dehydrogenase-like flavoprotein
MFEKLYRNAGLSFTLSSVPLWIPTGRAVGGTTIINSGTCIRTPEKVLEHWRNELELHDVDLKPYFPQVEQMLDVKPVDDKYIGGIQKVMELGLRNTEMKVKVLHRDETGCDGQSYCTIGCPTDAKRSTHVSYLPQAMKNNAHVFTHYQVQKIIVENGSAVGVVAQLPGFGPEFSINIRAKKVVIAAGAFQTPMLLKQSGLTRDNNQVGEHLTVHPALNLGALFDYKVWQEKFVPQSLGVFGQNHDDYILEGYTLPADSLPPAFHCYGDDLKEVMNNLSGFTNFAAMLKDHTEGRLHLTKWGVLPEYFINPYTQKVLKRAAIDLGQIFFKAGAKYIYAPIRGREKMDKVQFEQHFINDYISAHRYTLSAHHPLGTCRMSGHSRSGALDSECRLRGVKNLFVSDGSSIPGPLGVNPQITIMSNSLRVANIIHGELT